jgi:hypothetical protein
LLILGVSALAVLLVVAFGRAPFADVASGFLTLALMALAAVYAVRRRSIRLSLLLLRPFSTVGLLRPLRQLAVDLDRVQSWRTAHLVIGVLWALALFWHMGASSGTWVETALLAMCIAVLVSGVLGAFVQFRLPRSMLAIIEREVRVEDVEARRRAVFVAAEEKILGGSERLVDTYIAEIRPQLQGEPLRIRLFEHTLRGQDPGALLRGRLWRLLEGMEESDASKFRELIDLAEQKGRLDLNLYHLELSVGWLLAHDALVIGTGVLVALHLLSVAYF